MQLPMMLTWSQVAVGLAGVVLATVACLSPVHNDTWWHLAYGREILQQGGFAQVDRFSHTAFGQPFPNHQWLGEVALYVPFAIGGLPLLTAFCAGVLTLAWMLVWRLSRGAVLDRLLVLSASVAGSTLVWSLRPQVFTILLLPAVLTLLTHRRLVLVPVVILLWANLHGGVLLGLLAIATYTGVAAISERRVLVAHLLCLAASAATTMVTPLGVSYWPEIVRSLQRSQVHRLQEWQPPALPPEHFFFWAAAATLAALAIARWRRLPTSDRALVATALLLLPVAARSQRNVAPFMMLAGPALTRLSGSTPRAQATDSRPTMAATLAVAGTAIVALLIVLRAWTLPWSRLGWQPVPPTVADAIRTCPGPLYNTYAAGGPLIWFVPERRVFVDSRQDQFPPGLVQEATAVENGADPARLFERYGIQCAALPLNSPTLARLTQDGWRIDYADAAWVVASR